MAQPLELWSGASAEGCTGAVLETFVFLDPMKFDVLAACGAAMDNRRGVLAWKTKVSDLEGCTQLYASERLVDRKVDLLAKDVAVLSLLDAMAEQGFQGVDEIVCHTADCRLFDRRKPNSRRAYFQCVLHFGSLAAKGITEFRSTGTNSYFEALLRGRSAVKPGLSKLEYKKIVARDLGDELALAALSTQERQAGRRRPKAAPKRQSEAPKGAHQALADGDPDSESVVGGSVRSAEVGDQAAIDGQADAIVGGPESVVGGPAESEAKSGASRSRHVLPEGVPSHIRGVPVYLVPGRRTTTHSYSNRLTIQCCNTRHANCSKSRSLTLMADRFGARAAEAYLGAWMHKATKMTAEAHKKFAPKVSDMEEYLVSHP